MKVRPASSADIAWAYQPQIRSDGAVRGVEMLCRPADEHLIRSSTTLSIRAVQAAVSDRIHLPTISVNVEPHHVTEALLRRIAAAAARLESRVEVEFTERGPLPSKSAIDKTRSLGMLVAFDDVEPENVAAVIEARPDTVKFVDDPSPSPARDRCLLDAIGQCRDAGIETVIERVGTAERAQMFWGAGATYGQSYLWARPMTAEQLHSWVVMRRLSPPRAG